MYKGSRVQGYRLGPVMPQFVHRPVLESMRATKKPKLFWCAEPVDNARPLYAVGLQPSMPGVKDKSPMGSVDSTLVGAGRSMRGPIDYASAPHRNGMSRT